MAAILLNKISAKAPRFILQQLGRIYPPFIGMGLKIDYIAKDISRVQVSMPLTFFNRNYVGTHFGGSLFAMSDPFFMIILIHLLGKKYVVWDLEATIQYVSPGRGTVYADFSITEEEVNWIKEQLQTKKKIVFEKTAEILNADSEVVARVHKKIYIRNK